MFYSYHHYSRKLLAFIFAAAASSIILSPRGASSSSQNVNLDFQFFTLRNLTLLGDSYLRNGVIGLTRETQVPSSSSGSVVYNRPIPFFDRETNATASFSTRFSFSIDAATPSSSGDGFTFFLSPDNDTVGSSGGYLGLVNSSRLTKNRFVAVEFDTKMDLHFGDPNDNHVGLDIDSLVSVETANPMSDSIDLKSGNLITCWIDYSSTEKRLTVFLSYYSSPKPEEPILTVDADLSDVLKESMYAGFSGSTEGSTELHYVENWSFRTSGFKRVIPRIHPHNVSVSTVPVATSPPVPKTLASDPGNGGGQRRKIGLGLGLGIGFPVLFFFFAGLLVFGLILRTRVEKEETVKQEIVKGPRRFSYRELRAATRGFHETRILGHGAFGTVYKAFFAGTGTVSAVKRSKHSHEQQGKSEFLAELSVIAGLRHKNLVQLQGWCAEKGELLLVYEFMPNGSLDAALYCEEGAAEPLKWAHRYGAALGLASALTYLHRECEQQVIHRDIKASNVMLDGGYGARLGDFGLARLADHGKSPVSTLTAGTMGYLAPEYLQYGTATEKTDVFSYGVVVLELACGRRPIEREGESQRMVNLVDWVWRLYSEGRVLSAVDGRLGGAYDEAEVEKLLMVGLSCANPDSNERPSMRRVLQILNGEAEPLAVPKVKPALTFSNSRTWSIDEIFTEEDESEEFQVRVLD